MKTSLTGLIAFVDGWPRPARAVLKLAVDITLLALAFAAACFLRFGGSIPPEEREPLLYLLPFIVVLKSMTFCYCSMTRDLWRYAGLSDLARLIRVVGSSSLLVATFSYLVPFGGLPRGIFIIDAAMTLILTGGVRFGVRWLREMPAGSSFRRPFTITGKHGTISLERVLVVGAGRGGEMMIREMRRRLPIMRMNPIGLVDDDPAKKGMFLHGLTVLGGRTAIPQICEEMSVDRIVLCLPSVPGETLREIVRYCRATPARVDVVPPLEEILSGKARISDVRALRVEDLLGRKKVAFNMDQVASYLRGRRVLVTGAGGSIGSELCRQIIQYGPQEIALLGRGENSIFDISSEVAERAPRLNRHEIIGDVINYAKLEGVFRDLRPEIVFHAGADKHVPLMELNPDEAVLNNVIGTRNVLDAADAVGARLLVSISTDKAVFPTSVMGCCKRVAEMIIQSRPRHRVRAVAVRFGNVLGSRGSVIPLFQRQIKYGGPVTVTHPEVERYFMTIPEAVALVLQAGALGRGRDLFMLDMGQPVKIVDHAREMIRLAGFEPDVEIPISYSGLRPGEKLHEELVGPGQTAVETDHPKIMALHSQPVDHEWLATGLDRLQEAAVAMDSQGIIELLKEMVAEYQPARPVVSPHRRGGRSRPMDLLPSEKTH
ncbi:MAG: polysaccharide biosynthesis protein [Acidobacteriota bacterium]